MPGCLRSCLGRTVALVLLAAVAAVLWFRGPELLPGVLGWMREDPAAGEAQPSPELAETTLDRVEAFRTGEAAGRLALSGPELSSVVRYALPGILPPGVTEPSVSFDDGKMSLSARVAVSAFPDMSSLRDVVGMLPDTVDVDIRGSLIPHDDDNAALYVESVRAMKIPLPDRYVPRLLEAMGRKDREGLSRQAMLIPLPAGLESVYVVEDSLILVANR